MNPAAAGRIAAPDGKAAEFPRARQRHNPLRPRGAGPAACRRMKNPSSYLKMRVLGAIDMAPGDSIRARIRAVSAMTFTDEQGHARQFT